MSSGRLFTSGGAAVPRVGGDARYAVCVVCRGPARAGCDVCWSCHEVQVRLRRPIAPVIPLTMTAAGTTAHRLVVGYKAAISSELRSHASGVLATAFASWLERHLRCALAAGSANRPRPAASSGSRLAGGEPVLLVPVPSSSGGRPSWHGRHPLLAVCEAACSALAARSAPAQGTAAGQVRTAALLGPSEAPPSRLRPRADGFVVVDDGWSRATRLVVVDDIWTSGARAVSAAAALEVAGFDVIALVPFTRFVRPDHNEATASYWADVSRHSATIDRCAVCGPAPIGRGVVRCRSIPAAVQATTRTRTYDVPARRVVERLEAA